MNGVRSGAPPPGERSSARRASRDARELAFGDRRTPHAVRGDMRSLAYDGRKVAEGAARAVERVDKLLGASY